MASDTQFASADRRDILCGGGAFVFAALASSLLAGTKPVRADQVADRVPEVDKVILVHPPNFRLHHLPNCHQF